MASQTVSLVAVSENAARRIALRSGGKVKVQAGTKYLLQTESSQVAPENVTVKRAGKDLLVSFEGSDKTDLTLQDFFADGMDGQLYGVSEDGQLHAYLRTDGEGVYGPLLMAEGESAPIALGGDGVAYNVPLVGESDDSSGFILWPLLLGLAGIGAAAAIIHHNRDDGHKTHTSPAPANIKVMDEVGPSQGQLSNGDVTDDAHPAISGNGVPGAIIHLFDNGQEIGSTTVAPDGTWSFAPDLADGAHSFDATQVVPGQKPSAPVDVIDLIVDTLAPAKPSIEQVLDAVGSIQGPVANGGVTDDPAPTLSGKAEAGSTVTLYDNGQEMGSVVADDNGQWSYTPTTPLSEGEHLFTVDATDKAGNISEPSDVFSIVTDYTAPVATLSIDVVAGDDVVNLFESKAQQLISGKVGGEFLAGDLVTFTLNGTAYSAAVDAAGDWSVAVAGADLAEDSSIHATLVAHDAAGNNASVVADHAYSVDLDPPVATLTIDVVAGDDVVNLFESQVPQLISGKVGGEFMPGDLVTFTLNGTVYSAAVNAAGDWKVTVAGADLARETGIQATLVAHDAAGNDASVVADHAYIVDVTPPVATLSIDSVTSDNTINSSEAAGNVTISGKVSGEFTANDQVSFLLDGTTYSTTVTANGDWSVSVPGNKLVADSGHKIDASLVAHDAAGNVATISASHPYLVQLNSVSITSMSKDSGIDLAHTSDFITADGSAGRGVYGTLTQALTGDQKVQVSTDAGATWKDALISGLNWVAVDTSAHAANWTIQARIVENGVVQSDVASKAVTFLGTAGGAPSITSIPDADTFYTTAKSADGSDVHVSLAGTNAKAGDTLHIVWGDTSYDQVLTAADITSGAVLAKVPAQQTTTQGGQWDFAVTAQIVTVEGQISAPSSAVQIHGEGWTTLALDDLQRNVSTLNGQTVYQGGGITVTSNASISHTAASGTTHAGLSVPEGADNYAQINFTQAVSRFSVDITGLQNSAGGSRVVIYDTNGNVLFDQKVLSDGTGGTAESTLFSYSAPVGTDIAKAMIYTDGNGGIALDTLKFYQVQHAAGYVDTFTDEVVGKTTGYHSDEGHFTVETKGSVYVLSAPEHNLDGPYMYIGSGSSAIENSAASFIFDQAVQSISYSLWGLETQQNIPGNYSKLEVYDTDGALIFTRNVVNNGGSTYNYEQVSYTAPEGLSIGKAIVYQDQNACLLDNFTSVLAPSAPSGQKLIDHGWETYFDEATVTKGVIWQGQSFATSVFSGGATLEGYHSDSGGFTVNGSAAREAAASNIWANATSGSLYVADAKTAVVTFDSARSKVEIGITGIENTAGNSAVLKVYDTSGGLLDTIQMSNPNGTYDIQSFSYDAHGNSISRIEITGDGGGAHITSVSSSVTQVTAESDVISMAVDPMAYFAQDSAHIFGSSGLDTLKLTGANQVLDLTQLSGDNGQAKISSIEKFDITGTGDNTLKLSLNDVLHLGETDLFQKDGKVQVMVDGDAGDKVELHDLHDHGSFSGGWQSAGTTDIGGVTYQVYNYGELDAELLIKQAVTASIV
ncbi:Ig-like domain-containing protein [Pseudomonas nitroreducens]|uniref:Ig-like domain-containing protein n=1 Tax=Pseudomonas nitroreducens TaxID=46680 RepID=UPI002658FD9A|nr:Ig-like domain-containing protein [Pseudomonas nitroreducens]MCP1652690.1 hypothetical protein [Pseudomonas nitroreducens]MCP1690081.1 hypothetical protein [Pseudomonas nitroreducens]